MGPIAAHSCSCSYSVAVPSARRQLATRHAVAVRVHASSSAVACSQGGTGTAEGGQSHKLRRMILLRHADSSVPSSSSQVPVRDHDRPISELGRQEASNVAVMLKSRGWLPDLVLASNSKRTKQTLDEMAEVISELADVDAHYYGSLYTVAALDGQTREHISECLLEVVDDQKNSVVMCVGHNKGWEEAASSFCGQAVKLRTASAALLQAYASSWKDCLKDTHTWELVEVLTPAV